MKQRIIAEYVYKLPLPTDEEIRSFFEAEGVTDVNPEDVRKYVQESIYELWCKTLNKNGESYE